MGIWWVDPGQQLGTHQPLDHFLPCYRVRERIRRAKARKTIGSG